MAWPLLVSCWSMEHLTLTLFAACPFGKRRVVEVIQELTQEFDRDNSGVWALDDLDVAVWCNLYEVVLMDDNGWWWMMMDDDGWWWMMMDDDGWWWMMMDDDGWWWRRRRRRWWCLMAFDAYASTMNLIEQTQFGFLRTLAWRSFVVLWLSLMSVKASARQSTNGPSWRDFFWLHRFFPADDVPFAVFEKSMQIIS